MAQEYRSSLEGLSEHISSEELYGGNPIVWVWGNPIVWRLPNCIGVTLTLIEGLSNQILSYDLYSDAEVGLEVCEYWGKSKLLTFRNLVPMGVEEIQLY